MYLDITKRKKKGKKRRMPQELIKEFIGQTCSITLLNDLCGVVAKIIAVEENWIKVEEKNNKIRLINGDMIIDISLAPEKKKK